MAAHVIVVGGGLSGVAAATALAERFRVKLYEREPRLLPHAPEALSRPAGPHTQRLLERLGADAGAAQAPLAGPLALSTGAFLEARGGQVRTRTTARLLTDGGVRVYAREKEHRVRVVLWTAPLDDGTAADDVAGRGTGDGSAVHGGAPGGLAATGLTQPQPGLFVLTGWIQERATDTIESAIARGHDAAEAVARALRS